MGGSQCAARKPVRDSIHSAQSSQVSRNLRTNLLARRKQAKRRSTAMPLSLGIATLCAFGSTLAQQSTWDCRMAPDGRSWQCLKDGQPHVDPALTDTGSGPAADEPAATVETPAALPDAETKRAPDTGPPTEPEQPAEKVQPSQTEEPAAIWPAQAPEPAAPAVAAPPKVRPAAGPAAPAPGGAAVEPPPSAFPRAEGLPDLTASPVSPSPAAAPETAPTTAFPRAEGLPDLTAAAESPSSASALPTAAASPRPPSAEPGVEAVDSGTADIDRGIDWGTCRVAGIDQGFTFAKRSSRVEGGPIQITADAATAELEPQRATFTGNVLLTQDDVSLQAGSLTLNRATGEVEASQGFLLSQPDIRFAGSMGRYQTTTREAEVEQASYRIPPIHARGDAERAALLGNGIGRLHNITYTTCAPDDASWLLSAQELELDRNEGFGTAKHASLRFLGVPVLYAPRFSFPIDDRRRSGVLVPSVGYGENTGADVSVPYYFNLAENYDLTLTPRLMSKRGLMLSSQFRFLTRNTEGTFAADLLPNDRERDTGSSTRGAASLYTYSHFGERTNAALRLNYVSDSDYFQDLGGNLAATSATHLERTGVVTYQGDYWNVLGQAQYWQTIDDDIPTGDRPYSQLPLIRLGLERPDGVGGVTYHLDAEYANYHRDDSVRGHRIDLSPALSLPLGESWWAVEPKAGAHYTAYRLTDQIAGLDDNPSNLTGVFSLDGRLYFDRDTDYFGNAVTHTLEPRAYYLYVPSSGQDDQPLFDTAPLDFDFENLFRENRFTGPDRVGDANQLTLALTSRVNDRASGEELLRASVGQILYFEDRTVTLPDEPDEDDSTSILVSELAARLGRGWHTRLGLQWDPHDGDNGTVDQALAQLSYRGDRRQVLNTSYRLRDGVARQTDVAFFWPLNEQLTLIGRHNYSLREDRLLEGLAGIEYGECCWRIRALARKYTDSTGDNQNLAFMLQLELKGLGRLGDDIDSTLERGIYGYRLDDDD